jgi:hypothetical protein
MSVDGIRDVPSTELLSAADLVVGEPWMQEWFHVAEGGLSLGASHTVWSLLPNEGNFRERHRDGTYVDGERLTIRPDRLRAAMTTLGRDLILIVDLKRSRGDEYAKVHRKERSEATQVKAFLLRQDGSIEAGDGCVGAWSSASC